MRRQRLNSKKITVTPTTTPTPTDTVKSELQKQQVQKDIKSYKYIQFTNGKLVKIGWEENARKKEKFVQSNKKLFTIKCVESLIQVILQLTNTHGNLNVS